MSDKDVIARRVAQELKDGDRVNLGIGLPTLVAKYLPRVLQVHFHSENGNYGIVTDELDRVLGTEYEVGTGMGPSPTVRNLGYTSEEAKKYPWVAELDQAQSRN